MKARIIPLLALAGFVAACGGGDDDGSASAPLPPAPAPAPAPAPPPPAPTPLPTTEVIQREVATFENPWAMVFLPDGRLLVTERGGRLRVATTTGTVSAPIAGVPEVDARGQGGLLDVAIDPQFASNRRVYLSFAEPGTGDTAGLAVARGTLDAAATRLEGVAVIWRQAPKVVDGRHYGGRLAFSPDGLLFITAGERHQGAPAQDLSGTLGKIVRIAPDGTIPVDGPFAGRADARPEIWTLGHRNPYGLVFASDGRLFESEMGPEGGDEFNLVERGRDYGWRTVSEGNDGETLPRHSARPEFAAPLVSWTPVIAPGGMIQYRGTRFVGWTGDFILAGLAQQGLVRARVTGSQAVEIARIGLGARIREVEEAPDGTLYVLRDGASSALVQLTPR